LNVVEVVCLNSTDEAISATWDGFNKDGILGRVAQNFTQASDCRIQSVVKVAVVISRPESLAQLIACNQFAGCFEQNSEHLEGLTGDSELVTFFSQLLRMQVKFEVAKAYASADRDHRRHHFPDLQRI